MATVGDIWLKEFPLCLVAVVSLPGAWSGGEVTLEVSRGGFGVSEGLGSHRGLRGLLAKMAHAVLRVARLRLVWLRYL